MARRSSDPGPGLWRGIAAAIPFVLATLAAGSPALGERRGRAVAEARRHHQNGLRLFDRGEHEQAAAEFEAAQRLAPAASNLFNLARCFERLDRTGDAIRTLEQYLELRLPVERRSRAEEALERLRRTPGRLRLDSRPAGATVHLDGAPAESASVTPTRLEVASGSHVVELRLDGHLPSRWAFTVSPGEETSHVLDLVAEPEPEVGPEPEPEPEPELGPESAVRLTGALGLGVGSSIPVAVDILSAAVAIDLDLALGVDRGRLRVEGAVALIAVPHEAGVLLEAVLGPRLSIRLASLPLWVELEALVGLSYLLVGEDGLTVPEGGHLGLALLPGLALAYRPLGWLEVVVRPARVEVLGLLKDLPGGVWVRYALAAGLRFRF